MSKAIKTSTASYVELGSHTYNLFVDAYASANQRGLEYAKSLWELSTRPYSTNAVESAIQENFDRASKIVALTVAEMQSNGQKAAELTEAFAAQAAKLQETYAASLKGLVDTSLDNLNYVKDTATAQLEDITKRFDEIQKTAVAAISNN